MAPRKKRVLPTATKTPIFTSAPRNKPGVKKPSETSKQAQRPTVGQLRLPQARPLSPFHYDEYEAPPSPPLPPSPSIPKSPRKKRAKPVIPFDEVTTIPMSTLRAQQVDRSAILRKGSSLIPRDPVTHFYNEWRKHHFNRDMDPGLMYSPPELRAVLGLSPKWKDPTKTKVPKSKTPFGEGSAALLKEKPEDKRNR